ncbi:MAG: hypothetical protein HYX89_04615 [Chloroflexi bacterium]|nr:hypothetical protein [Chloroflexota bacterium]
MGSGSRRYLENSFQSQLAEHTVVELASRKSNLAASVGAYFRDMGMIFQELRRVIKPGGRACIIIGDTALAGVPIMNAEVYAEQLIAIGFELEEVIKRRIPSKILPQGRDPVTGRFASSKDVQAYPHEYILVARRA